MSGNAVKWSLAAHMKPFMNAEREDGRVERDREARKRDILHRLDRLANQYAAAIRNKADEEASRKVLDLFSTVYSEWDLEESIATDQNRLEELLLGSHAVLPEELLKSHSYASTDLPKPDLQTHRVNQEARRLLEQKIKKIFERDFAGRHAELAREWAAVSKDAGIEEYRSINSRQLVEKGRMYPESPVFFDRSLVDQAQPQPIQRMPSGSLPTEGRKGSSSLPLVRVPSAPTAPTNPSDPRFRNVQGADNQQLQSPMDPRKGGRFSNQDVGPDGVPLMPMTGQRAGFNDMVRRAM